MAEITGFFTLLDTEPNTGLARFTGTDIARFLADSIVSASSGKCYVSGSIINTSPIPCKLRIISGNMTIDNILLGGYGTLKMTRLPFTDIKIAINGTVALKSIGFVTDFVTEEEEAAFLTQSGIELIDKNYKNVNHLNDFSFDSDITTNATTAVIANLSVDDRNLAVGKIFLSSDVTVDLVLRYLRGSDTQVICSMQLSTAFFAIIDDVPPCILGSEIRGTDVELQVITTNIGAGTLNVSGFFSEE